MAGAPRLSRAGERTEDRGRPHRGARRVQPVRLLRRALGRELPVPIRDGPRDGTAALSRDGAGGREAQGVPGGTAAGADGHGQLPRRHERAAAAGHRLYDPHGAGRSDAGGDADAALRLVPRLGLAAGPTAAPLRNRRALRLRLPDPAQGRPRPRSGTPGHAGRFHRPPRLGGGLCARRGLDRHGRDIRPALRRGAHPRLRHPALPVGRADLRHRRAGRGHVRLRHARHPCRRAPAHLAAVLGRVLGAARRPRRQGRRGPRLRRRPAHHGRRADLRLDRRFRGRRVEFGGGRPCQTRPVRRVDPAPARAVRAGRHAAFRAGQVVPRREPAALGLRPLLAPGRRADLVERRPHRRRADDAHRRGDGQAAAGRRPCRSGTREGLQARRGSGAAARPFARLRRSGLRGPVQLGGQGEQPAGQRRSARSQDRGSRDAQPDDPHLRARADQTDRLRAPGAALELQGGLGLGEREVAAAARSAVPRAGRFADRLPAAALGAGLHPGHGLPLHQPAGPDRGAPTAAAAGGRGGGGRSALPAGLQRRARGDARSRPDPSTPR